MKKIIFDTDLGADADDLGALAMLHHFIDQEECKVLAIMCWSTEKYAVSAIDAVNHYYNHPNIPIGRREGSIFEENWQYSKLIADNFYHKQSYETVENATLLYRRKLAQSDNNSVTMVVVGPLKNIENLLRSEADTISDLSGKELVEQKVQEFVIMGGNFPKGDKEWNFDGNMPGVTKYVINNITVPITFSGYELGEVIKTGAVFNEIDPASPLYLGFEHFSKNAPWVKGQYNGKIIDNSTFDQTAVLYAVRNGVGHCWEKVSGGICVPDDVGGNVWVEGVDSKHSYLRLKMDREKMAGLIEDIMLGKF